MGLLRVDVVHPTQGAPCWLLQQAPDPAASLHMLWAGRLCAALSSAGRSQQGCSLAGRLRGRAPRQQSEAAHLLCGILSHSQNSQHQFPSHCLTQAWKGLSDGLANLQRENRLGQGSLHREPQGKGRSKYGTQHCLTDMHTGAASGRVRWHLDNHSHAGLAVGRVHSEMPDSQAQQAADRHQNCCLALVCPQLWQVLQPHMQRGVLHQLGAAGAGLGGRGAQLRGGLEDLVQNTEHCRGAAASGLQCPAGMLAPVNAGVVNAASVNGGRRRPAANSAGMRSPVLQKQHLQGHARGVHISLRRHCSSGSQALQSSLLGSELWLLLRWQGSFLAGTNLTLEQSGLSHQTQHAVPYRTVWQLHSHRAQLPKHAAAGSLDAVDLNDLLLQAPACLQRFDDIRLQWSLKCGDCRQQACSGQLGHRPCCIREEAKTITQQGVGNRRLTMVDIAKVLRQSVAALKDVFGHNIQKYLGTIHHKLGNDHAYICPISCDVCQSQAGAPMGLAKTNSAVKAWIAASWALMFGTVKLQGIACINLQAGRDDINVGIGSVGKIEYRECCQCARSVQMLCR
eukprot:jgi/Astpho2/3553/fgenesh1_pg.00057_%23_31_t